jgi:hypothetical protein
MITIPAYPSIHLTAVRDMLVIYDLERQRIGFAEADCDAVPPAGGGGAGWASGGGGGGGRVLARTPDSGDALRRPSAAPAQRGRVGR